MWEYKIIMPVYAGSDASPLSEARPIDRPGREIMLNNLGRQGWELVAVYEGWFYLKRKTAEAT